MSNPKQTSPCCGAEVKLDEKKNVFICQKDKTEIEPHLVIYSTYPKKQTEEIRDVFKRTQKESTKKS